MIKVLSSGRYKAAFMARALQVSAQDRYGLGLHRKLGHHLLEFATTPTEPLPTHRCGCFKAVFSAWGPSACPRKSRHMLSSSDPLCHQSMGHSVTGHHFQEFAFDKRREKTKWACQASEKQNEFPHFEKIRPTPKHLTQSKENPTHNWTIPDF
eukprot:530287-Amphidinium_carterae.3